MRIASPQHYIAAGQQLAIDPLVLENASLAMSQIWSQNNNLFPLLTLNHLSVATGLSYGYLRNVVARKAGPYLYSHFYMRKRVPGRRKVRMISIPAPKLMQCQSWIVQNILKHVTPHAGSYAYHPHSNPVFAARRHTEAVWLIKVDIQDFSTRLMSTPFTEFFGPLDMRVSYPWSSPAFARWRQSGQGTPNTLRLVTLVLQSSTIRRP